MAKCKMCGDEIRYDHSNKRWSHINTTPRHPATPIQSTASGGFLLRMSTNHKATKINFQTRLEDCWSDHDFAFHDSKHDDFTYSFEVHLLDEVEYPVRDFIHQWIEGYMIGNMSIFETTI